MTAIHKTLNDLAVGNNLTPEQSREAFTALLTGQLTPAQSGALLMGLSAKGETPDELNAAVDAAMGQARLISGLTGKRIDTCGTGGDGKKSFNCSTAVALFLADLGYQVVKHGNRAVSSQCGSADVVESLGYPLVDDPGQVAEELRKRNFVFLFAPHFHPAFKHVAPIRQELKIRTLFNLMGPLLNPAEPTHQIIGIPNPQFAPLLAKVLVKRKELTAAIVHGAGGFDEITPCGTSSVLYVDRGRTRSCFIVPRELGISLCKVEELICPTRDEALAMQTAILTGNAPRAVKDMVALNLGLALHLLEDDLTLKEGVDQALEALDNGLTRGTDYAA